MDTKSGNIYYAWSDERGAWVAGDGKGRLSHEIESPILSLAIEAIVNALEDAGHIHGVREAARQR